MYADDVQHRDVFLRQRKLDRQLRRAVRMDRMEAAPVHEARRGVDRRGFLCGEERLLELHKFPVAFFRDLGSDAAGRFVDRIADRKRMRGGLGERRFARDVELTAP